LPRVFGMWCVCVCVCVCVVCSVFEVYVLCSVFVRVCV